jgi:hypothetical protein
MPQAGCTKALRIESAPGTGTPVSGSVPVR